MKYIHEHLRKTFAWYDKWHNDIHSSAVSWGIFVVIALLYTLVIVDTANKNIYTDTQTATINLAYEARGRSENGNDEVIARLKNANDKVLTQANEHAFRAPGLSEAGVALLRTTLSERQATIQELAFTNPKEIRQFVFDEVGLQSIPSEARNLVEKPFSKQGTYRITLAIDPPGENATEYEEYFLEVSDTERYRLAITEEEAYSIEPETQITVTGVELLNSVLVPTSPLDPVEGEGEVLGASTVKKIAIVAFNFRNNPVQPITTDVIRSRVFTGTKSVNAYYKEISYGQWEIQGNDRVDGDVLGWVTIDVDAGGCDYGGWASKAKAALTATGVNMSGYTNIQYVFPGSGSGCGWAGIAYINGMNSWVRVENLSTFVSGHELGHNFGFHHAASYGCSVASSVAGTCSYSEYGDNQDIMGSTAKHTNNYNKSKYWYQASQITTVTQPGTFTIEPTEISSSGTKVVRIKRPFYVGSMLVTDGYYQLEFLTPFGFDSYSTTDPNVNGVTLRLVAGNYLSGAQKTYRVSVIPAGGTFSDPEGGIIIHTLSTTPAGAVVNIELPVIPCYHRNPTVSVAPYGQWGTPGSALSYTTTIKNNDTESCGASTFSVKPTLPTGFEQSPTNLAVLLNPGEQKSNTITVSVPLSAVPASYLLSEFVQNDSSTSNTATASVTFNVTAPDITAPTIKIITPTNGATVSGRKQTITATASDPSSISRIEISVDGKMVKSCTRGETSCSYSWNLGRTTSGAHTIGVAAVDKSAQLNRGETEITVTK